MRLPATFSVLLLALAATPASGDGEVQPLKIGKPPGVKALDTFTLTSETTFSQKVGKQVRKATRAVTETITVLGVEKTAISRARVSVSKTERSGKLSLDAGCLACGLVVAPGTAAITFGLDLGDRTRGQLDAYCTDTDSSDFTAAGGIVFDAGDGFTDVMVSSLVQHHGWLVRGVPLRSVLSGRTFTPGTTVNLGGQEIEIVYAGLTPPSWSSLPGGSMTYQSLDAGIATFGLTTTVTLALPGGTTVSGELAGTLTIDTATASLRSIVLEGDVSAPDGGTTYRLVQRIYGAVTTNEN